jgi:hypothetical protein
MRYDLRAVSLALVVAVATAVMALLVAYAPPARAASDRMPDLGMLHPKGLYTETVSVDGVLRRELRFTTIIVNTGEGPFEIRGKRDPDASTMDMVQQRIFDDVGGSRYVDILPATLVFGGDGHNHWHVTDLEHFELQRLDNGSKVGTFEKRGFCFVDSFRYTSSNPAYYLQKNTGTTGGRSCSPGSTSATETHMGLSIGWGDRYSNTLPDQYINITGLNAGNYRLVGTADPNGWFTESDNTNNVSWIDIKLTATDGKVRIVARGPSA